MQKKGLPICSETPGSSLVLLTTENMCYMTPDTLLDTTPHSGLQKSTMMYRRKQCNFRIRINRRLHSRLPRQLDVTVNRFHASQFPKTYIRPLLPPPLALNKGKKNAQHITAKFLHYIWMSYNLLCFNLENLTTYKRLASLHMQEAKLCYNSLTAFPAETCPT